MNVIPHKELIYLYKKEVDRLESLSEEELENEANQKAGKQFTNVVKGSGR